MRGFALVCTRVFQMNGESLPVQLSRRIRLVGLVVRPDCNRLSVQQSIPAQSAICADYGQTGRTNSD